MKLKVRLDFCDLWAGFIKNNNFFYNQLRNRFDIEICDRPDFIIYSDPGQHIHRIHNCVKIYFCVEDFLPDFREYDYCFSCRHLDDPRHLRLPYYALASPTDVQKRHDDFQQIMASKTKFCSFLTSYDNNKTRERVAFFKKLCKYKKVDSAGRALNNVGFRVPPGQAAKIQFLQPYKFNIAFESAEIPGYTTEKILEAMQARCMPIYWGNRRIDEEFNPKSFLNYYDFASEEALIEKIIELDQVDAKYAEYLRQPYFHNDAPNDCFDRGKLLDFFERIFTTQITPVSTKRFRWQIGRWIPVLKNRPHR